LSVGIKVCQKYYYNVLIDGVQRRVVILVVHANVQWMKVEKIWDTSNFNQPCWCLITEL